MCNLSAMALDRITDIIAFVRVADARSFTVAAEQLGLSRSAVGKCVTRLEDQLGVRLLHRTTRSVTPTDEGEAFYERCIRILADLEDAELAMASRSERPRGRLRLDLPVSFGRLHVLPLLHRFMATWPDIVVNVTFTDRYVDLIDEGVDLALRIGGEADSQLVARTLAPHRLVTCATPDYLAARGTPRTPADLADHSCLAFTHAGRPADWRFRTRPDDGSDGPLANNRTLPVHGRFCASNAEALRDAALAGYGIGQLATFLVGDDLRAGRLVPVLEFLHDPGAANPRRLSDRSPSFAEGSPLHRPACGGVAAPPDLG
ncbi:LysR family transcriptional regulator [Algihabitans albus]|uniref:LysR family transcriptional regulator n=1 Tax=Algihabitans albus TaxID=2164067 RepID=UPI0035D0C064